MPTLKQAAAATTMIRTLRHTYCVSHELLEDTYKSLYNIVAEHHFRSLFSAVESVCYLRKTVESRELLACSCRVLNTTALKKYCYNTRKQHEKQCGEVPCCGIQRCLEPHFWPVTCSVYHLRSCELCLACIHDFRECKSGPNRNRSPSF